MAICRECAKVEFESGLPDFFICGLRPFELVKKGRKEGKKEI
jgi:hypothetical protein